MKKFFLTVYCLLFTVYCFSQDTIPKNDSIEFHKILLIPFNPKMYDSDANKEIISASKINFDRMVERFRAGLTISLREKIPPYYESKILFADNDTLKELEMTYNSVDYKYQSLDVKLSPLANKNEGSDSKIIKGQIVTKEDKNLKFMNIAFKNKELFSYFFNRYGADIFLFVNQLDIKNDLSDYVAVGNNNYQREIKVHYSIFNKDGKQLYAGLSTAKFPSTVNDIQTIINNYFPIISGNVTSNLSPPLLLKKK